MKVIVSTSDDWVCTAHRDVVQCGVDQTGSTYFVHTRENIRYIYPLAEIKQIVEDNSNP